MSLAKSINLLPGGLKTVGVGAGFEAPVNKAIQATVSGTGTVSATVNIEGSVLGDGWVNIATFTLTGPNVATDGFLSDAPWTQVRATVTAISGVNATVTAGIGV